MANRATEALMGEIITLPVGRSITAFARAAHIMVYNLLEFDDAGLTEETLVEIEVWLAIHLLVVATDSLRLSSAGVAGKLSASYAINVGRQMESTIYGQQVLLLDTSGRFRVLSDGGTPSMRARLVYVGENDTDKAAREAYWDAL